MCLTGSRQVEGGRREEINTPWLTRSATSASADVCGERGKASATLPTNSSHGTGIAASETTNRTASVFRTEEVPLSQGRRVRPAHHDGPGSVDHGHVVRLDMQVLSHDRIGFETRDDDRYPARVWLCPDRRLP